MFLFSQNIDAIDYVDIVLVYCVFIFLIPFFGVWQIMFFFSQNIDSQVIMSVLY